MNTSWKRPARNSRKSIPAACIETAAGRKPGQGDDGFGLAIKASAGAFLALLISACATTGDPRHGGLFGWSPGKARERQQALEQQDAAAQQRLRDAQQSQQTLQGQQTTLVSDRDHLQTEVDGLLAENTRLTDKLASLMQQARLQQAESDHLKQLLARNELLRRQAGSGAGSEALSQQNQELNQDVQRLLSR